MRPYLFFALFFVLALLTQEARALEARSDGTYHLKWKKIETPNNLPPNPLGIVASTDPSTGDFVAVANDGTADHFYFLDHAHRELGWQKTGCFFQAETTGIFYGLGRFFVVGIDHSTHKPVIATSADNGKTWSQRLILAGTSSYNSAAFSDKFGMITGKEGAVATTVDGNIWFETTPPSGIPKKLLSNKVATPITTLDYQFQLFPIIETDQHGFLTTHDTLVTAPPLSCDGRNWIYPTYFPLSSQQLLIDEGKGFFTTGKDYWQSSGDSPISNNYLPIDAHNEAIPHINLINFICYGDYFVGVGTNIKTGTSLSLLAPLQLFNASNIISTDILPTPMTAVAASQNGFVALAQDGTTYFSSATVETEIIDFNK